MLWNGACKLTGTKEPSARSYKEQDQPALRTQLEEIRRGSRAVTFHEDCFKWCTAASSISSCWLSCESMVEPSPLAHITDHCFFILQDNERLLLCGNPHRSRYRRISIRTICSTAVEPCVDGSSSRSPSLERKVRLDAVA